MPNAMATCTPSHAAPDADRIQTAHAAAEARKLPTARWRKASFDSNLSAVADMIMDEQRI